MPLSLVHHVAKIEATYIRVPSNDVSESQTVRKRNLIENGPRNEDEGPEDYIVRHGFWDLTNDN